MTSPFENPAGTYLVLQNAVGQHSLWPAFVPVPRGWSTVHPPATHRACRAYLEGDRTGGRPAGAHRAPEPALSGGG